MGNEPEPNADAGHHRGSAHDPNVDTAPCQQGPCIIHHPLFTVHCSNLSLNSQTGTSQISSRPRPRLSARRQVVPGLSVALARCPYQHCIMSFVLAIFVLFGLPFAFASLLLLYRSAHQYSRICSAACSRLLPPAPACCLVGHSIPCDFRGV
jgi:hypothetical protein